MTIKGSVACRAAVVRLSCSGMLCPYDGKSEVQFHSSRRERYCSSAREHGELKNMTLDSERFKLTASDFYIVRPFCLSPEV